MTPKTGFSPLTTGLLAHFLELAGKNLKGEWVLIGGTLLAALGIEHRSTLDIDFVSCGESGTAEALKLMEIAEQLGLPVETINQAGVYFLRKIPDYQKNLVILAQTPNVTIYRPNLALYFRLKLSRLTPSDLDDCLAYLRYTLKFKEPFSSKELLRDLEKTLRVETNPEKAARIETLRDALKRLKV